MVKKPLYTSIDYFIGWIRRKEPGIYYLLEETIGKLKKYLADKEKYLDPEVFSEERKYMMLVIDKDPASPK